LKGSRPSAQEIIAAIEAYGENPAGKFDVKLLKGKYGDFKRLRVGHYRIIFDEASQVMTIYEIKHRQEAHHD
jgi:mRNA-degrading endonuclease RelE of RelBE toxin-antitoxin system